MVPLAIRIPPVPNRTVAAIPGPALVKIGFLGIRNLMKTSTIGIDDADRRLPIPDFRSVRIPAINWSSFAGL